MRKDEEVKELFQMNIELLEKDFRTKATVTTNGIWIQIEFGGLATVKGRGYLAALRLLDKALEDLAFGK